MSSWRVCGLFANDRLPFDPPPIHSQFEVFQCWDWPGWKEEFKIYMSKMSCLVNFQSSFKDILSASQTNRVLVPHCCPHDVLITITPILAKQSNHYVMLMARKSASAFRNEKAIPRVHTVLGLNWSPRCENCILIAKRACTFSHHQYNIMVCPVTSK